MDDQNTTIQQLRQAMARFVSDRDWQKFHRPKNLAMSLAIETAELMEHFQWVDHDQADDLLKDPQTRQEISDEIADVLSFLLSLSNATGIDLASAFEAKMIKTQAKYPAEQVRGRYKKPKPADGKQ